ncbi:fimbria/pilus outer membrane usher protein [Massilia aurea]|uniref:fimbria/pilus outer membrane usher protein n=1 Tax=Massilia aurea TaxID=373040 RepID=UPI0034621ABA
MHTRHRAWRALRSSSLSTCLLALSLTPIAAAAAEVAAAAAPASASLAALEAQADLVAAQPTELYLDVSIDGQATGLLVAVMQQGASLRMTVESLRELGLDPARFGVADRTDFLLDEIDGMTWRYDSAAQTLALTLSDRLRVARVISARSVRASGAGQASRGVLLNYNVFAQSSGGSVASNLDLRYFDPRGSLTSTGAAILRGEERGYTRYDTTWIQADQDRLSTVQLGDTVTPALSWSRALRLGGVEWRRNFELRPDLVTYPVASIAGSAVVPTSVDLFVNNVRQFSTNVPTGPFVVDQVAGLNGAGQATVITRDALGREVATTLPLYVDTRLLARGLTDFAVSLGALRRDYGVHSFRYGGPAAVGSIRHGWTDRLTLEAHAEAGSGQALLGGGVLARVPGAGVASGALAASAGQHRGWQATLGYQYVSPRFALDLQSTRASAGFGDLGTLEGTPVPRALDRASISTSFAGNSLSMNLIQLRTPLLASVVPVLDPFGGQVRTLTVPVEQAPAQLTRTVSLAWSRSVGLRGYFSLGAFQDLERRAERGITASFSMAFDSRVAVNTNAGRQRGEKVASVSMGRAPDFDGGLGWALQAGKNGPQRYDQAQVQYLGSHGRAIVSTQRVGENRNTSLDVSGAIVAMDGTVITARNVGRGFALVSAGAPDLPVLQDNRPIGRTDRNGRLLVPDLQPYAASRIAIDPSSLPSDIRIPQTNLEIVPRQNAGVVARFEIERYAAATLTLVRADGRVPDVGTQARLDGSELTAMVGYDGVLFVEGLRAQNRVRVGSGKDACEVRFDYKPVAGELPTIGPLVCQPLQGE